MAEALNDSNFREFVKGKKVIVDFWASWCGPCRVSSPLFEELSKDFEGKLEFAKVNVDENPETAQKYGIMSIPAFLVFEDGEKKGEFFGAMPKEMFREKISEFV